MNDFSSLEKTIVRELSCRLCMCTDVVKLKPLSTEIKRRIKRLFDIVVRCINNTNSKLPYKWPGNADRPKSPQVTRRLCWIKFINYFKTHHQCMSSFPATLRNYRKRVPKFRDVYFQYSDA